MMYAYLIKARKNADKPNLFTWFDSKSDSRADREIMNILEDAEIETGRGAEYQLPVRTNVPVFDDLPEERVLDETWCERYELAEDGKTWQKIAAAPQKAETAPAKAKTVTTDGASEKVDTSPAPVVTTADIVPPSDEKLSERLDEMRNLDDGDIIESHKLPFNAELAHFWLGGMFTATPNERNAANAAAMDMDNSYLQNVILALNSVEACKHCFNHVRLSLLNNIKKIWPVDGKAPALNLVLSFAQEWMTAFSDASDKDGKHRADVVDKWLTRYRKERTPSGATAGGGNKTDRRLDLIHTLDTLDIEIALASLPMDFNIYDIPGGVYRRAKEIVQKKESPFKEWSTALRKCPGILDYSRAAIFALIRSAADDVCHFPVSLQTYINANLTESNHEKPTAETLAAARHAPEESWENEINRKIEAEREANASQDSAPQTSNEAASEQITDDSASTLEQPEVTNLGNGMFSIEGLIDAQSSASPVINTPSNEVEKEENQTAENTGNEQMEATDGNEIAGSAEIQAGESADATGAQTDAVTAVEILAASAPNLAGATQPEQTTTEEGSAVDEPVAETTAEHPAYFEPGRYEGLPNEVYHAANGISSTQVKDARISLMYYYGRHVARTIPREETRALQFGTVLHALTLEPEKFGDEFTVFPGLPEGAIVTTAEMKKIIEEFNAALPPLVDADSLKKMIEAHNSALPAPLSLNGNAEETALLYQGLADEFRRIPETEKHTAAAMKACIKEFNTMLPQPLKVSGGRDSLLEQLATIEPEFVAAERAKKQPYNISGNKDALATIVREINPESVFAEEFTSQWQAGAAGKSIVSDVDFSHLEALNRAAYANPSAGKLLRHPSREVEVSYFGIDEQTGLEVRVRPDIELEIDGMRIAADLKTLGIANVKQERLRDRLHREIIERDYHLSAAMYSEVGDFDQFFWIFINKEPGYHWVAVIEASPELLELGSLEYHNTMQAIATGFDTGVWPAPITSDYTDELNDFDMRRLEALRTQA